MATLSAPGVYVIEQQSIAPITGVGTSTAAFIGLWADPATADPNMVASGTIVLCTNFTQYTDSFGGYSATVAGQNTLAHAVRGFFNNGGTVCYVARAKDEASIDGILTQLEAYDDVAMLVAPGIPADPAAGAATIAKLVTHCSTLGDRIAILDAPDLPIPDLQKLIPPTANAPFQANWDFAALYTPWVQVYDPPTKKTINVPPSGHIAGIYARTDATRGVHKAPANETVAGVGGLSRLISRSQQGVVNADGLNCIRSMNGAIKVWGARTLAGEGQPRSGWKYVPTRRLMSYLAKSIDHGTQWAVFEPNGPDLWAKLIRNIGSFLTSVWAQGALAGTTPQEAFYVKCDAENNPPDQRGTGLLVIDVGVAVLYPAEFVEIRIQHDSQLAK